MAMSKSLKLTLSVVGLLVVLPEVIPVGLICLLVYGVKKGWKVLRHGHEKG